MRIINHIFPDKLPNIEFMDCYLLLLTLKKSIFDRELRSRGLRNRKGCDGDGDGDGSTVR